MKLYHKISKQVALSISAAGLFMVAATSVRATPISGELQFAGSDSRYRQGNGGEFSVGILDPVLNSKILGYYDSKAVVNGRFQTFCLESDEYIGLPSPIYAFQISNAAKDGGRNTPTPLGGNTTGMSDRISQGTAWLYAAFAKGTLAGYDYNNLTSAASAQFAPAGGQEGFLGEIESYRDLGASAAKVVGLADMAARRFGDARIRPIH